MQEDFGSFEDEQDDYKSKTQIKREMHGLQVLGEKMVNMGATLDKLPLDDELIDAIELARRINRKKDGYRRQLQFIGKLLRKRDIEPIEQALERIENSHQLANRHFHQLEQWRDRLIQQKDAAVNALVEEHPEADRQKLRQLVRQAEKQASENKPPKAAREIFQYLKELFPHE